MTLGIRVVIASALVSAALPAVPAIAQAYARAFTEDDLRSLIAFYRTPVGQRLVTKLPEVLRQIAEIGAERGAKHQAELQSMLLSHLAPPADTAH